MHTSTMSAPSPPSCGSSAPRCISTPRIVLYDQAAEHGHQFGVQIESPPPPDEAFVDGQTLVIDDVSFVVAHTPGHSPGGVTLIGGPGAFVGDSVFAGSIGRTDLPGGKTDTLLAAIVARILSLPPATRLFPGHGPETTVAAEAATNPFLAHLIQRPLRGDGSDA